ncbi:MAG: MBL fold metallo-hydrolase [Bryobacteraceae bacterium]|nr:MBL fold metallo-hydrolase [Bryobacteraceae bacterium]
MRLVAALLLTLPLAAQVTIEYVAHAAFVLEAVNGQRLVIDPYNSERWLGYTFPENVPADFVLVTHPHYDHDASYYFRAPVLREPGEYTLGAFRILGVPAKHAGGFGAEFGQKSTVFVVETGGVRVAHFGDAGPLDAEQVKRVGRVDVVLLPIDGDNHILKPAQIEEIRKQLKPSIVVPMHYQLPELSDLPDSLGPIEPWLAQQPNVTRLRTNRWPVGARDLRTAGQVWAFPPSPEVRPWPVRWQQAWQRRAEGLAQKDRNRAEAVRLLEAAHLMAPEISVIAYDYASLLPAARAIEVLTRVLSAGGRHDFEYTERAHLLLAEHLATQGRGVEAAEHCQLVLATTERLDLRRRATALAAKFLRE